LTSPATLEGGDDTPPKQVAPPNDGATETSAASRSERVAAAIEKIWSERVSAVLDQIDVIEEAVGDLLQDRLDDELRKPAQREAHKLAGSLGTFGFTLGSSIAREMEAIFARGGAIQSSDALRLSELLVQLREEVSRSPSSGPKTASSPHPAPAKEGAAGILVVGRDEDLANRLVEEAAARDLRLRAVPDPKAARSALSDVRTDLVLIDLDVVDHADALSLVQELSAGQPPLPAMVLAGGNRFADRLEVARVGGHGFLRKPLSAARVLDAAGEVIDRVHAAAPKVLILDDDPHSLSFLETHLQAEGVRVTTLADPEFFWESIQKLMPDLIILDIDMPGATGLELCRVLRMDHRWRHVPVLFVTADHRPEVVGEVFAAGADDLVRKSASGSELVARVKNRLERVDVYRTMTEIDALTGVATRARASETLDQLLHLADRYHEPLCLALIDVDNLQEANSLHGHGLGDQILRRLGELLKESFRGEDVVGRWTEDQFCLGMYGLHIDDGVQRVAELLERFRSEEFDTPSGDPFRVSFSAGVAAHPQDGDDLVELHRRAEGALEKAIEMGRRRVLPAGWSTQVGRELESADVVIVEDDDTLAGLLTHTLQTQGFVVHRFSDGQKAAASLAGASPTVHTQVVLLDVELPGLNGLGVLRRLAQSGVLRRSRVIMLTARAAESEVLEAMKLGAFDHVAKPFSLPVLMQRIRRTMRG
jgi:diguanylate cyclase (GGDEF)-like protein